MAVKVLTVPNFPNTNGQTQATRKSHRIKTTQTLKVGSEILLKPQQKAMPTRAHSELHSATRLRGLSQANLGRNPATEEHSAAKTARIKKGRAKKKKKNPRRERESGGEPAGEGGPDEVVVGEPVVEDGDEGLPLRVPLVDRSASFPHCPPSFFLPARSLLFLLPALCSSVSFGSRGFPLPPLFAALRINDLFF